MSYALRLVSIGLVLMGLAPAQGALAQQPGDPADAARARAAAVARAMDAERDRKMQALRAEEEAADDLLFDGVAQSSEQKHTVSPSSAP